ncbi:MAG: hypothetical protein O3C40_24185 [Planctomycetota bacterium]|nr:hypothetical protein [Planctomycetota bacterium]
MTRDHARGNDNSPAQASGFGLPNRRWFDGRLGSGEVPTERFGFRLGSGTVPTGGLLLAVGWGRANGEVGGFQSS